MTFSSLLIKGNEKKKKHIKEYNDGNINYMKNMNVYVCVYIYIFTKSL